MTPGTRSSRRLLRNVRRFGALRAVAVAVMSVVWIAFAVLTIMAVRHIVALDVKSLLGVQPGLPPDVQARVQEAGLVIRALQGASTEVLLAVGLFFLALLAFVIVITDRVFLADKVSVLGFKFEISETLRDAEERASVSERMVSALGENISELQELDRQMNALVRDPSDARFFDVLDAVTQAASFTIRPTGRAVRVSLWLYNKTEDTLRIIAGYRVAAKTRETFEMKSSDRGFAAQVLRDQRMLIKNDNFVEAAGDWKDDKTDTHGTVSILGVPVPVDDPGWDAVLCFSTDRQQDAFSYEADRAEAEYFATIGSTLVALALSGVSEGQRSMVEEFWVRYRRA